MRLSEVERDGLGRTPSNLLEPYIESIISRHCALEREARDAEWKAALTNDGAGGTGLTDHFKSLLEAHDAEVGQQASVNHLRMREETLEENAALRAEKAELQSAIREVLELHTRPWVPGEWFDVQTKLGALLKSPEEKNDEPTL